MGRPCARSTRPSLRAEPRNASSSRPEATRCQCATRIACTSGSRSTATMLSQPWSEAPSRSITAGSSFSLKARSAATVSRSASVMRKAAKRWRSSAGTEIGMTGGFLSWRPAATVVAEAGKVEASG